MERVYFEVGKDGFHGVYWQNKMPTTASIIAMLGDDAEDYMAKSCVKWLQKQGVNVLSMSPAKKNYSHHNYPLERIGMIKSALWARRRRVRLRLPRLRIFLILL